MADTVYTNSNGRNIALLAACQALLFANNSTLIAINGLAGLSLAPYAGLATLPGVHDLEQDGLDITCRVDAEHLDALLRTLVESGVRSLTSRPPSLEELFLAHYRQAPAEVAR